MFEFGGLFLLRVVTRSLSSFLRKMTRRPVSIKGPPIQLKKGPLLAKDGGDKVAEEIKRNHSKSPQNSNVIHREGGGCRQGHPDSHCQAKSSESSGGPDVQGRHVLQSRYVCLAFCLPRTGFFWIKFQKVAKHECDQTLSAWSLY